MTNEPAGNYLITAELQANGSIVRILPCVSFRHQMIDPP